jgi:hypothetical protein
MEQASRLWQSDWTGRSGVDEIAGIIRKRDREIKCWLKMNVKSFRHAFDCSKDQHFINSQVIP